MTKTAGFGLEPILPRWANGAKRDLWRRSR